MDISSLHKQLSVEAQSVSRRAGLALRRWEQIPPEFQVPIQRFFAEVDQEIKIVSTRLILWLLLVGGGPLLSYGF